MQHYGEGLALYNLPFFANDYKTLSKLYSMCMQMQKTIWIIPDLRS